MADRHNIDVIIPAFRPADGLLEFVGRLRAFGFGEIVVVDDGSPTEYEHIFRAVAQLPDCRVLSHHVNQGKGRALKTGFDYCTGKPGAARDIVTCDADGQHAVEDVVVVADRLVANRADGRTAVVWGSRDFDAPGIPWRSRLGNKTTSWLVKLATRRRIGDTQTGLRGFPHETVASLLAVDGERFEYEMNVLKMLLEAKTVIDEVPIKTIYHDLANSQSHFRPVRDSLHVIMQLSRFVVSSVLGSAVDLLLYALLVNALFAGRPNDIQIVSGVVIARAVSSFVNFMLNRDWVFGGTSSRWLAFLKYYLLVGVILMASALGSVVMTRVLGGHAVLAKAIADAALFFVSYSVQKHWVFARGAAGDATVRPDRMVPPR